MVTPTPIQASYDRFVAATAALRERFRAPLPDVAPCSISCPPVHDDCQAMLVILLQNAWADFCKELLRLSMEGKGPTLTGTVLTPVTLPRGVVSLDSHFRLRCKEAAGEMPNEGTNPIWHNPEYVIRVSMKINPANNEAIRAGLGGSAEAKNVTAVRNYVIHGTKDKYEELLNRLGARGLSVPQLLAYQPRDRVTVFESWIEDLVAAAQNAAS